MQRFAESHIANELRRPVADDHKYSRGVLGVAAGSGSYPGAAVLVVEGALRTGIGMVRYAGPQRPEQLVLHAHPEAVPGAPQDRCDAWVLGPGCAVDDAARLAELRKVLTDSPLGVLDAGALGLWASADPASVLTPHAGELASLLDTQSGEVVGDPEGSVRRAATMTGRTVLLKGAVTRVVGPGGEFEVELGTPWLATAGTGDVLSGIIGALLASHADELRADAGRAARLAAAGAAIHGLAGRLASASGPFPARSLGPAIAQIVHDHLARPTDERS